MMKRLCFLLICVVTCCGTLHAEEKQLDSLLQVLPTLPHDSARLQLLEELALAYQHTPHQETLARQLIQEAQQQDNPKSYCTGIHLLMLYYYNYTDDTDSLSYWLEQMKEVAIPIKEWRNYFEAQKLLINNYIYAQQYEYAIHRSNQMLHEAQELDYIEGVANAYYCLANAYNETGRDEEERQVLNATYRLFPRLQYHATKMNILSLMMELSLRQHQFEATERYTEEYKQLLKEREAAYTGPKSIYHIHWLYAEAYTIYCLAVRGDFNAAEQHIATARSLIDADTYPSYVTLIKDACVEYLFRAERYDEALQLNDSIMKTLKEEGSATTRMSSHLLKKARILQKSARFREAIPCYEAAMQMQDSLRQEISDMQLEEFKMMRHLNDLLSRQAALKEKKQLTVLVTVCIIVLLCLFYIRHIRRVRRALRRAEQETQRIARQAEEANEEKTLFLSNLRQHISRPIATVVSLSRQLAEADTLDEETRRQHAATIRTNTEQLIRLVNNVLDLSRLEAHMTKWQLDTYDLVLLCREAVDEVHTHHPAHEVELRCEVEQFNVRTDGRRMMQLFLNLLSLPYEHGPRRTQMRLRMRDEWLEIIVINSPLTDPSYTGDETRILHDIHRMTMEYFHGVYQPDFNTEEGPVLRLLYPSARIYQG